MTNSILKHNIIALNNTTRNNTQIATLSWVYFIMLSCYAERLNAECSGAGGIMIRFVYWLLLYCGPLIQVS